MFEEYLLDLHHKFDIITITETWFKPSTDLSIFQLDGYDIYHLDTGNKNGGWVAIYIYKYAIYDVLKCLLDDVLLHNKNIVISCLYKHTTFTIDELVGSLEKLCRNKQCDIYLCGDFNINSLNQTNNVTNAFLQCLYSLCMFPHINKPMYITNHSAILIDNVFYNAFGISHNSGILVNDIRDHLQIFAIREENLVMSIYVPMVSYMKVRNIGKRSMKIFCEKLVMELWYSVYAVDVNSAYNNFIQIIDMFSKYCLIIVIKSKRNFFDKPWLMTELKYSCRTKKTIVHCISEK